MIIELQREEALEKEMKILIILLNQKSVQQSQISQDTYLSSSRYTIMPQLKTRNTKLST